MNPVEFFEHFEGKDWLTAGLAGLAIVVSIWAVLHNRRANLLNELAKPVRFTAQWREIRDRDTCVLELKNTGDSSADRLRVRMAADPYQLMGLVGTIREPVKPDQKAEFTIQQGAGTFKYVSSTEPYGLMLYWHDNWGKARAQRVDPTEISWGDPIEEYGNSDSHRPQAVASNSGLYDPRPWLLRRLGRPAWKLRRDKVPALDHRPELNA